MPPHYPHGYPGYPGYGPHHPYGPHPGGMAPHIHHQGYHPLEFEKDRTCGCCPRGRKGKFFCWFCLLAIVGIVIAVPIVVTLKGHSHASTGVQYPPGTPAPTTVPGIPAPAPAPAPAPPNPGSSVAYKKYTGDGSPAQGWPTESDWVDFTTMWSANTNSLEHGCSTWNVSPENDSEEILDLKNAILSIAAAASVDARFVLATVMQESRGCVRVDTTQNAVANPGLMQSHDGTGTCNVQGTLTVPCPDSEIQQMITDGTQGTSEGPGLKGAMSQAGTQGAQQYYRASRIYNSGSIGSGILEAGAATATYCSDIANRLLGWAN